MNQALEKRGFNASAKSIDPGLPAQFVLADMGRNYFLFMNCLHVQGPF